MIIHISGPSGSGKTTMLLELQQWSADNAHAIGVFDADDATPTIYHALLTHNQMNSAAGGLVFKTRLSAAVEAEHAKYNIIVVGGLIDTVIGGTSYCADIKADHKFYIKIDDVPLLTQYLSRIACVINNTQYHARLLGGDTSLLFDRSILLQWKKDTHDLYCGKLGYIYQPYDAILAKIKAIIKNAKIKTIITKPAKQAKHVLPRR